LNGDFGLSFFGAFVKAFYFYFLVSKNIFNQKKPRKTPPPNKNDDKLKFDNYNSSIS
jgi:hypothetical protein